MASLLSSSLVQAPEAGNAAQRPAHPESDEKMLQPTTAHDATWPQPPLPLVHPLDDNSLQLSDSPLQLADSHLQLPPPPPWLVAGINTWRAAQQPPSPPLVSADVLMAILSDAAAALSDLADPGGAVHFALPALLPPLGLEAAAALGEPCPLTGSITPAHQLEGQQPSQLGTLTPASNVEIVPAAAKRQQSQQAEPEDDSAARVQTLQQPADNGAGAPATTAAKGAEVASLHVRPESPFPVPESQSQSLEAQILTPGEQSPAVERPLQSTPSVEGPASAATKPVQLAAEVHRLQRVQARLKFGDRQGRGNLGVLAAAKRAALSSAAAAAFNDSESEDEASLSGTGLPAAASDSDSTQATAALSIQKGGASTGSLSQLGSGGTVKSVQPLTGGLPASQPGGAPPMLIKANPKLAARVVGPHRPKALTPAERAEVAFMAELEAGATSEERQGSGVSPSKKRRRSTAGGVQSVGGEVSLTTEAAAQPALEYPASLEQEGATSAADQEAAERKAKRLK